MRISKDITVGEVVNNYPNAIETLRNFGVKDMDTLEAQTETLGKACEKNAVQVDKLIEALKENVESEIRW